MKHKFGLAAFAAMALCAAAFGGSTEASANPWSGYGGPPHGYHGGPPPWARAWGWRHHRHHRWGGPPPYGWSAPPHHFHARPYPPHAPFAGRGYGPY